ncbi:MAG: tetratricopeptide repeat protein [Acidimicrobiia bacterium]|nr:tetratricopeptide repeat protein [Acidimicrobiia bacterium]
MSVNSPYIVETTQETFERDVVDRSRDVPVVVDFWAEWCGPCRTLGPRLERLAEEYGGKFVLVKADTERVPEIAAAFGIRSIPAVFGLKDGKLVDSFVGVLPESELRAFLDRLLPTPAERLIAEARGLESSDLKAAEARYRIALDLAPEEPQVKIGLARVLLAQDRPDEARPLIEALERRGYLEPEAEKLKADLTLRSQAEGVGGVAAARAAAAADPDNPDLAFALAEALAAAGRYPEAMDLCLDLIERHRKRVGESAHKLMLTIFQLIGDAEIVADYQRKLASALF